MGLKTSCDGCGRGVTGAFTALKKVDGKYLCPRCAANPTGAMRYYCTSCNSYSAYAKTKGSGWIELILYLCYLIPGIIYSIWRRGGNSKLCSICNHATLDVFVKSRA